MSQGKKTFFHYATLKDNDLRTCSRTYKIEVREKKIKNPYIAD